MVGGGWVKSNLRTRIGLDETADAPQSSLFSLLSSLFSLLLLSSLTLTLTRLTTRLVLLLLL